MECDAKLILASGSPRRQQLIQLLRCPVEIMVADVDERSVVDPHPAKNAVETALLKARAVAPLVEEGVVIGADTNVALGELILGKPVDSAEAEKMLTLLRNQVHEVHTGIAVCNVNTGQWATTVSTTAVTMRDYADAEIAAYIASGDPMDKAGAYAIQSVEFNPVAKIKGCYAGVVGLSLCELERALQEVGVNLPVKVGAWCQKYHFADFDVYERILSLGSSTKSA